MASNTDSDTHNLLLCTICLEEFEESGEHIPRLLPCTHTLCEVCVKQLIYNQNMECPECRTKHSAKNEEKSFPQNKYLLMLIKRKPAKIREGKAQRNSKEICIEHKKVIVLFCKEPECLMPVCLQCLKNDHRKHDIVGIADQKEELLMMTINYIEKNLMEKVSVLSSVKYEVNRKTKEFVKDLERRRDYLCEEIKQQFDDIKKETESQEKQLNSSVDNETAALNESLNLLSYIRSNAENIDENEEKHYSDTMDRLDILNGVKETVNRHLSGERSYTYPKLLSEKFMPFNCDGMKFDITLSEIDENNTLLMTPMRSITRASQLKCTGKQTLSVVQTR